MLTVFFKYEETLAKHFRYWDSIAFRVSICSLYRWVSRPAWTISLYPPSASSVYLTNSQRFWAKNNSLAFIFSLEGGLFSFIFRFFSKITPKELMPFSSQNTKDYHAFIHPTLFFSSFYNHPKHNGYYIHFVHILKKLAWRQSRNILSCVIKLQGQQFSCASDQLFHGFQEERQVLESKTFFSRRQWTVLVPQRNIFKHHLLYRKYFCTECVIVDVCVGMIPCVCESVRVCVWECIYEWCFSLQ